MTTTCSFCSKAATLTIRFDPMFLDYPRKIEVHACQSKTHQGYARVTAIGRQGIEEEAVP